MHIDTFIVVSQHLYRFTLRSEFKNGWMMQRNTKGNVLDERIARARSYRMEDLLLDLGSEPSSKEKNKWHCPFHGGGSFHVWPEQNRGKCFGCDLTKGRSVDPIGLLMVMEKIDFVDAVVKLSGTVPEERKVRVLPRTKLRSLKKRSSLETCPEMNSRIYHDLIRFAKGQDQGLGRSYMESRGIPWDTAHGRYSLTWLQDPDEASEFLSNHYWSDEIESSGLMTGRNRFCFRLPLLLVPYFKDGFITEIEGLIRKEDRGGAMGHGTKCIALSGIPRGLWGLDFLRSNEEVVLVEGVIDALSMIILTGKENVLSVPGVSNMRRVIESDLRLKKKIRILADRDPQGEEFSIGLKDALLSESPDSRIIINRYPEGLNDANDWLKESMGISA